MYTLEEQKEHRKQWVEALRSEKYNQGFGALKNNNKFCCLGVACDISKLGDWDGLEYTGTIENGGESLMPDSVRDWLGLQRGNASFGDSSLWELNDGVLAGGILERHTFEQIADIIESEPEGLFVK